MEVVQVIFREDETRPAFDFVPPELTSFNPGQRVLSAYDFNNPNETSIYFKQKHEPGEPYWPEGGYECTDIGGGFRAFYLDALMIHPSQVKTSQFFSKNTKRGRPKRIQVNIDGSEIEPVKKLGKRGRPKKYAEGQSPSALAKTIQENKPKGKRGRPPKNPGEIVQKQVYVPKGTQRGRPRMYEPGQSPSELKKKAEQESRLLNPEASKGRGRPKKLL